MKPLRILLVEDDKLIGALLAEMLDDMGHSVCGVETTEAAAVSAALLQRPDLMIVDARLATGSGIAAIAEIFRTVSIPHIFVTGDRMAAGPTFALVLQKPFTQRTLAHAIQNTVDLAGQLLRTGLQVAGVASDITYTRAGGSTV